MGLIGVGKVGFTLLPLAPSGPLKRKNAPVPTPRTTIPNPFPTKAFPVLIHSHIHAHAFLPAASGSAGSMSGALPERSVRA